MLQRIHQLNGENAVAYLSRRAADRSTRCIRLRPGGREPVNLKVYGGSHPSPRCSVNMRRQLGRLEESCRNRKLSCDTQAEGSPCNVLLGVVTCTLN